MKNKLLILGASLVTSLFVCRPSFPADAGVDLAKAEAAVRKADAAWAATAGTANIDAWMAFYAADAIVLLPDEPLASGKKLVRAAVTRLLAQPDLSVAWRPIKVQMAPAGDLAYLAGSYERRYADSRGAPVSDRGRVLEIWRKQTDGTWKCIVDTWNPDESAAPPPQAAPEPLPAAHAPVGKYGIRPIHYQETIRQYFQDRLKDPNSVQYRQITQPKTGYTKAVTGALLMRETRHFGWIVTAAINAKNSRGSYVGFKTYTFLFRGEKIVDVRSPLPEDEID